FPCRRCVQRSTMLMRHRELYYRQLKDQRNLQHVYLVVTKIEHKSVISWRFPCRRCVQRSTMLMRHRRVHKAQRLPWQEVVRCVDSLCRFVKLMLFYG
ncbi:hypothetical protein ZWY2020_006488, partial [Hordeum vulgare]